MSKTDPEFTWYEINTKDCSLTQHLLVLGPYESVPNVSKEIKEKC